MSRRKFHTAVFAPKQRPKVAPERHKSDSHYSLTDGARMRLSSDKIAQGYDQRRIRAQETHDSADLVKVYERLVGKS